MNLINRSLPRSFLATAISLVGLATSHAGPASSVASADSADTRYGLFGLLDRRSSYGQAFYPEPLLNAESDVESEFRFDWMHSAGRSHRSDELTIEIEQAFGLVTLEAEFEYEWEKEDGKTTGGVGNVDLGARVPVFQYVSRNGGFDTSFGVGLEVGIPTNTVFSQSTEVVPKIFNNTRLGKNLSVQTIAGYSMLFDGEEDGVRVFEYGVTVGYTIPHKDLPIPGVQQLIPVLEIAGERQLNKEDSGRHSVVGLAGVRANFNAVGPVQPRWGIGFAVPLNHTAREEMHWGIVTSLVFEY